MHLIKRGERQIIVFHKTRHIATYPQHSEEESDKEEEGSMAHTTPSCHQEKLLLGHLTYRSV